MYEEPEKFDRNTQVWLNYKFSEATMKEIGHAFGIIGQRVSQIGCKRDLKVKNALVNLGRNPFEEVSELERTILDTLYGIRVSYELDEYMEYNIKLTLEDHEKILSLVKGSGKGAGGVRYKNKKWTSQPERKEQK